MTEADDKRAIEGNRGAVVAVAIREDLMLAIRSGRYPPGSQLPNERQLAERHGASRQQVRDALLLLSEAGLIERKVGSGGAQHYANAADGREGSARCRSGTGELARLQVPHLPFRPRLLCGLQQ